MGTWAALPIGVAAHGDDTRGGSGSKVNIDAMVADYRRNAIRARDRRVKFYDAALLRRTMLVKIASLCVRNAYGIVAIIREAF